MKDKEAILSIIYSNFDICADVYENRHNLKCINFCNSCKYRDIDIQNVEFNEYPCWVHRIADMLLGVVPLLDISKKQKNKKRRKE